MVCPQFRPSVGGYERAAERLATTLARRGHAVDVATERRQRAWPATEQADGVRIFRFACVYRRYLHSATTCLSFVAFLARRGWRYEVVHVHQYGVHAALAVAFSKLSGAAVVLKLTSSDHQGIAKTLGRGSPGWRAVARLHRRVDACVAVSETTAEEGRRFGIPETRIRVIPNGVDTSAFAPADGTTKAALRAAFGVRGTVAVLYLGRLSAEKNPLGLLRAWRTVTDRVPTAELVYVGSGPEEAAVAEAVDALGLQGVVRLAGASNDPAGWYRASDVYVLPSHNEGFSNSLAEALSAGLPVVSTRVSGSTDVFSRADVGELVPVGDENAIAGALCSLLLDPERRSRCGRAARELALQCYSVDRVAESTELLYRLLLQGRVE